MPLEPAHNKSQNCSGLLKAPLGRQPMPITAIGSLDFRRFQARRASHRSCNAAPGDLGSAESVSLRSCVPLSRSKVVPNNSASVSSW